MVGGTGRRVRGGAGAGVPRPCVRARPCSPASRGAHPNSLLPVAVGPQEPPAAEQVLQAGRGPRRRADPRSPPKTVAVWPRRAHQVPAWDPPAPAVPAGGGATSSRVTCALPGRLGRRGRGHGAGTHRERRKLLRGRRREQPRKQRQQAEPGQQHGAGGARGREPDGGRRRRRRLLVPFPPLHEARTRPAALRHCAVLRSFPASLAPVKELQNVPEPPPSLGPPPSLLPEPHLPRRRRTPLSSEMPAPAQEPPQAGISASGSRRGADGPCWSLPEPCVVPPSLRGRTGARTRVCTCMNIRVCKCTRALTHTRRHANARAPWGYSLAQPPGAPTLLLPQDPQTPTWAAPPAPGALVHPPELMGGHLGQSPAPRGSPQPLDTNATSFSPECPLSNLLTDLLALQQGSYQHGLLQKVLAGSFPRLCAGESTGRVFWTCRWGLPWLQWLRPAASAEAKRLHSGSSVEAAGCLRGKCRA